jgi:hypothetical protein
VIVACHQPIFLPWAGFFVKALLADVLILLDDVQLGRGFTWMNRNRLKCDQGELWLTVPIRKKGRGLQKINEVEVFNERNWHHKHLQSIMQNYTHAPYLSDHLPFLKELYQQEWKKLVELNCRVLFYLRDALGIETEFVLQSDLGVQARGTELLVEICRKVGAGVYRSSLVSKKYLDEALFEGNDIQVSYFNFSPPLYPQLWGDFIPNLSALDLLLNCGRESLTIIRRYNNSRGAYIGGLE